MGPVQYDEKIIAKSKFIGHYKDPKTNRYKRLYRQDRALVGVIYDAHSKQFRHICLGINENNKREIIINWIKENVAEKAILLIDSTNVLNTVRDRYNIMKVNHGIGEYSRESKVQVYYHGTKEKYNLKVTNNRIEGFWANFNEQKNVTFQHRYGMQNLSYYLTDTAKRLSAECVLKNGLGVALTSIISSCKRYIKNYQDEFHKSYNSKSYLYNIVFRNNKSLIPI